ncbi:4-hydroxy-tetrahydrodipicolinate reductase [Clostridium senegalense]|uniref:4-hydroxy-tetrahydrodipicolinate reductase n=1 Tax=Clostridium senegalense TaxID=1465809 RepID=UPI00028A3535|nr:4-hydroxy-tetrahydrodipicolinate reductase [Clostridium senegalense]
MIKVLLVGCSGKMGKMISATSKNFKNLEIVAGIDKFNDNTLSYPIFSTISDCNIDIDVILDFSRPDSLKDISTFALKNNKPVIFCTTGYSKEEKSQILELSNTIPIFYSANMSIGINIVNAVLKNISNLLFKDFDIEIIEKHHNQKVDAPSGTALLLANTIKDSIDSDTNFIYGREGISKRDDKEIGIHTVRGGNIVGEHEVIFAGAGEVISIKHSAISREVFAIGALRACEFMFNKSKGLYSMDNIVNTNL